MQNYFCKNIFYKSPFSIVTITIVAVLLRITPIIYLEIKEPEWHEKNINEIEFYYDDVARSLIVEEGFVHSVNPNPYTELKFKPGTPFSFVPPLYSWFVYIIYKIFGPNVFIAKIFTAVMDGFVCVLIFLIGKKFFKNYYISLVGAALYAFYPLSIVMAGVLYYQIPMNLLLCWLLLCLLAPMNAKNGAWAGVALGLSALAKPVTLPLFILLPIGKAFESLRNKSDFSSVLKWTLSFIVAGLLVLLPWTIRNYKVFNEFVPVQRGGPEAFFQGSKNEYIDLDVKTLRIRYEVEFREENKSKKAILNHFELIKNKPFSYLMFLGKKFALAWYNTEGKVKNTEALLIQIPFLILAIAGTFAGIFYWLNTKNAYMIFLILFIIGIQVIIFPLVRYSLAIMPMIMILSSVGVFYIFNIKKRKSFIENTFINKE